MILILLIFGTLFLAYSNGANDNFKGVATLLGSKTASYRTAIILGTAATFLGSITSIYVGLSLIQPFSGQGLVPDYVVGDTTFLVSVLFGAGIAVITATLLGLPTSTTHSLTGALIGAGLVTSSSGINSGMLWSRFFLPLLISPFAAIAITTVAYPIFRSIRLRLGVTKETCICVGSEFVPAAAPNTSLSSAIGTAPMIYVDNTSACLERYSGAILGISAQTLLDALHYVSAATVSFARGLNDTPKIVGLLLLTNTSNTFGITNSITLVGIFIAFGGLINSKKIAKTMSYKITDMNTGQGFTSNLTTSLLVICASLFGLPVSTTHVSCGSLFGIGVVNGTMKWKVIFQIVLAWITTLPVAGLISASICLVLTNSDWLFRF